MPEAWPLCSCANGSGPFPLKVSRRRWAGTWLDRRCGGSRYTESVMASEYVELRGRGYYVIGTRISLASVIYGYLNGESRETIQSNFDSLTLEQVYGAIAYYLGHRAEIDDYLKAAKARFEAARSAQRIPEDLRARLERAREQLQRRP